MTVDRPKMTETGSGFLKRPTVPKHDPQKGPRFCPPLRETGVSRHNGGPIKSPLLIPEYDNTVMDRGV